MSENQAKISVIIPIFNMGTYLPQCLDNILNQTLRSLEIIGINDGSTDDSLQILQNYALRDSRIRIISQENKGVSAARNAGITAATGEFIAFMDPDDLYPTNDVLEHLYHKACENQVEICGGEMQQFTPESAKPTQNYRRDYEGYLFSQEGRINYHDYQFDYGFYRFIYKRDLLLKHNLTFPSYARFQDPPFMVAAFLAAGYFYAIPRPTYSYRVEHKTVNWTPQKIADLYQGICDVWLLACTHNLPRLKRYAWARIREHYPATAHLLTQDQHRLIRKIETNQNPNRDSLRYKLFSKDKNFSDPRKRALTILGKTYFYRK